MYEFQIPAMSCKHCVQTITEAVQALDPAARVSADLARHQVQVDTTAAREQVVARLAQAGYSPG